jgi:hypothetical protein
MYCDHSVSIKLHCIKIRLPNGTKTIQTFKMKLNIWQYTSIILFIAVLLLSGCYACEKNRSAKLAADLSKGTVVKTKTETVHDTVPVAFNTPVYVPKPYKVIVEKPVPVYVEGQTVIEKVDTAAILKDYYSTALYSDTQNVSNAQIIIDDQVSQNRIKSRKVSGNIQKEIITNTITNTVQAKKHNAVFVGIGGGYWNTSIFPNASLMFLNKSGVGYEVTAGVMNGQPMYSGGIKFKISFKK